MVTELKMEAVDNWKNVLSLSLEIGKKLSQSNGSGSIIEDCKSYFTILLLSHKKSVCARCFFIVNLDRVSDGYGFKFCIQI